MIVRLKDHSGSTILINTEKVLFIGQAAEKTNSAQPLIGKSLVIMEGGGQIMLDGSPDRIYELLSGPEFLVGQDERLRGN